MNVLQLAVRSGNPVLCETECGLDALSGISKALPEAGAWPLQGVRSAALWPLRPMPWRVADDQGRTPSVLPAFMMSVGGDVLGVSVRARERFERSFGRFGEFLPIAVEGFGEPWFLFNVLLVIDAVDRQRSRLETRFAHQMRFAIRDRVVPAGCVFRLRGFESRVFCATDESVGLADWMDASGYDGVAFELVQEGVAPAE